MKTLFVFVLLLISFSLSAQSLKDSLFGGKLKNPLKQSEAAADSARKASRDSADAALGITRDSVTGNVISGAGAAPSTSSAGINANSGDNLMPDSLNKLFHARQRAWQRFIDQQTLIVSAMASDSRKVKKGDYFVEFDYQIGLNGRVKVSNITCSPHNDFIIETMGDIMSRPPVLSPPIYADGKPRVFDGKQQMTIARK